MPRLEQIQTSFSKGVLTPRLRGRIDFSGYFDGAARLENVIVLTQGGALKRSGSRFVAETKDSTARPRLLPFLASVIQSYVIEAGNTYFRFFTQEGRLEVSGTPVEITTPYLTAELDTIKYTQSADIMYLAHANHKPRELQRTSPTTFSLVDHDFLDGPYLPVNKTSTTMTVDGASGSVTITASSTTGINDGNGFQSGDVDRVVRIKNRSGGGWTWYKITAITDTLNAVATVRGDNADSTIVTSDWRLGEWYGPDNWPQVVTFHNERLFWGMTTAQPQTFWASRTGDFNNHEPSNPPDDVVSDSHALNNTIASNTVNAIRWMSSGDQGLLIGTSYTEVLVRPASTSKGLAQDNIEILVQANFGSKGDVQAIRVGRSTIFVQRDGREIKEAAFDFGVEGFTMVSLTVLAEDLFRDGVDRLAFTQAPVPVLWALTETGKLNGLTFDKSQKMLAWHTHPIGDASAGGGIIEDVVSIPEGPEDQLWFVAKRTINGAVKRYVEFVEGIFEDSTDIDDAFFLDSGLSGNIGGGTVVTGLDHLEGETVGVLADGATHPDKTVSSGSITLDRTATKVHVGLKYKALVELLPAEVGTSGVTTVGKLKRPHQVHLRFDNTVGAKSGRSESTATEILFRDPSMSMDQPVPPFTGIKTLSIDGTYGNVFNIVVLNDQPLPFHLLSVVVEAEVSPV